MNCNWCLIFISLWLIYNSFYEKDFFSRISWHWLYVNVIAIAIAIIIVSTNIIFFVISDWLSDKVTFRAVLEPAKNDLALFHLQRLFSCTVLACCESCKKEEKKISAPFLSILPPPHFLWTPGSSVTRRKLGANLHKKERKQASHVVAASRQVKNLSKR